MLQIIRAHASGECWYTCPFCPGQKWLRLIHERDPDLRTMLLIHDRNPVLDQPKFYQGSTPLRYIGHKSRNAHLMTLMAGLLCNPADPVYALSHRKPDPDPLPELIQVINLVPLHRQIYAADWALVSDQDRDRKPGRALGLDKKGMVEKALEKRRAANKAAANARKKARR